MSEGEKPMKGKDDGNSWGTDSHIIWRKAIVSKKKKRGGGGNAKARILNVQTEKRINKEEKKNKGGSVKGIFGKA